MTRKNVLEARVLAGGVSILLPYEMPLGNIWELKLECGHTEYRAVKYIQQINSVIPRKRWGRRSIEDALPAPKKVRCRFCKEG